MFLENLLIPHSRISQSLKKKILKYGI